VNLFQRTASAAQYGYAAVGEEAVTYRGAAPRVTGAPDLGHLGPRAEKVR